MSGLRKKSRLALLSLLVAMAFPCGARALKDKAGKELPKEIEAELRIRLGLQDPASGKGLKRRNRPTFVIQLPGLAGNVAAASSGDVIDSIFGGLFNVIENGALVRTPAKSDFVYPEGEAVRIDHISLRKKLTSIALEISTVREYAVTPADGGEAVHLSANGNVIFYLPPGALEQGDYDSVLATIFQWIAPQNPSALPRRENAPPPGSPKVADLLLRPLDSQWKPQDEPFEIDPSVKNLNIGKRGLDRRTRMPVEQEIGIGKGLATALDRQVRLLADPVANEYVNRVGQNLGRNSDLTIPLTIKVVGSSVAGVWELPGAFIYISTGLILMAADEAQLSFPLAHSIAHVAARHDFQCRPELTRLSLADLLQTELPVAAEAEADYLAEQYMNKAGYDPRAGALLAAELRDSTRRENPRPIAQSSAPHLVMSASRILAMEKAIAELQPKRDQYIVSTSELEDIKRRIGPTIPELPQEKGPADDLPPVFRRSDGSGQSSTSAPSSAASTAEASVELREGQTPQEVEGILGKPGDSTSVEDNLIYTYATVKVFFKKGKLVDVQERQK